VRRLHSAFGVQLFLSLCLNRLILIVLLYDVVLGIIHGFLTLQIIIELVFNAARTVSLCVWASVAAYKVIGNIAVRLTSRN